MPNDKYESLNLNRDLADEDELLKLSESISRISKNKNNLDLDFNKEVKIFHSQLKNRMRYWELSLSEDRYPHPRHIEIMALFHSLNNELESSTEINILENKIITEGKKEELLKLFSLLEKELSNTRLKNDIRSTFSETKSIDRSALENEFKKFTEIIEKDNIDNESNKYALDDNFISEIYEENDKNLTYEQLKLKAPSLRRLFVATILDLLIVLCLVVGFIYLKYPEKLKYELILSIASNLSIQINLNTILTTIKIILAYSFILFLYSVLYDGSPGQRICKVKILGLNGNAAKIRELFIRFLFLPINFLTLGLRYIILMNKRNGYFCPFSKTYLSQE